MKTFTVAFKKQNPEGDHCCETIVAFNNIEEARNFWNNPKKW